jgi:hypothetical protein
MNLQFKPTPIIPLNFWDDIFKAPKSEWPSIVRKYKLDVDQLNYVAKHREEVFKRLADAEESLKLWNEGASKYYSKFGIKVN